MHVSHWRREAAPIIAAVLEATTGKGPKAIRAALVGAYPFGERRRYPYRIWLDEIARQLGRKPPLGRRGQVVRVQEPEQDPRQLPLFPE